MRGTYDCYGSVPLPGVPGCILPDQLQPTRLFVSAMAWRAVSLRGKKKISICYNATSIRVVYFVSLLEVENASFLQLDYWSGLANDQDGSWSRSALLCLFYLFNGYLFFLRMIHWSSHH